MFERLAASLIKSFLWDEDKVNRLLGKKKVLSVGR